MIRHDDVDAELPCAAHHFERSNAGVDADDEMDSVARRFLHHLAAHAVAVLETVRHVKLRVAAGELDRFLEDYDCRRAVDVVISIDQYSFAVGDGGSNARGGIAHPGHQKRIVQML